MYLQNLPEVKWYFMKCMKTFTKQLFFFVFINNDKT